MIKKKEKKGSHIGVILSFTIFVSFIFFFYVIAQPAIKSETKQNQLEILREKVIRESRGELNSFSIMIDLDGPLPSCAKLLSFFSEVGIEEGIIARSNENVLDSKRGNNDLFVKTEGNSFFKIYESNGFDTIEAEITEPCQELSKGPSGYLIGLTRTEERILETGIILVIDEYFTDYENLKEKLAVSKENEFGLGFSYSNGTELGFSYVNGMIVSTRNSGLMPPPKANVFLDEIPVEYIGKDASRKFGTLKIILW